MRLYISLDSILKEPDIPVIEMFVEYYKRKMGSGQEVPAVEVWEDGKGYRIIDGFHRVEAARRLGWTEMAAIVCALGESEFWSERVMRSKTQHEIISSDRILVWMCECIAKSDWYGAVKHYDPDGNLIHILATVLYRLEADTSKGRRRSMHLLPEEIEVNSIQAWFADKSEKWNTPLEELKKTVFGKLGWVYDTDLDRAAQQAGLDEKERNAIADQSGAPLPAALWQKKVKAYVEGKATPQPPLQPAVQEPPQPPNLSATELTAKRQEEAGKRKQALEQSEAHQKQLLAKQRREYAQKLEGHFEALQACFNLHKEDFAQMPEVAGQLAYMAYWLQAQIEPTWPGQDAQRLIERERQADETRRKLPQVMATPGE